MQGLADGYFVAPNCVGNYLATQKPNNISLEHPIIQEDLNNAKSFFNNMLKIKGQFSVDDIHKKLGRLMWDYVGMARNEKGLKYVFDEIEILKEQFYNDVNIPGNNIFNPELEKAGRLADFLELGQLMAMDALTRNESCGGHFREEYQTAENEALRNDKDFAFVSAWEHNPDLKKSKLYKERLDFKEVKLTSRSYK